MAKQRLMFHTQEYRLPYLTEAKRCNRDDAWLGTGHYFWNEEEDAVAWGLTSKGRKYTVYTAKIDCEDVLDTVFNEDHYKFWVVSIEKAIKVLSKKTYRKLTIADINSYFMNKGGWGTKVKGIMFQDLPSNETISKVLGFYYHKRIQVAVFNKEIITNFAHHFDGDA